MQQSRDFNGASPHAIRDDERVRGTMSSRVPSTRPIEFRQPRRVFIWKRERA
jgi:hypothetical protein